MGVLFCIGFAKGRFKSYMLHERLCHNSSLSLLSLRLYSIRPVVDELAIGHILLRDPSSEPCWSLQYFSTFIYHCHSWGVIEGAPYCVLGLYCGASSLASTELVTVQSS